MYNVERYLEDCLHSLLTDPRSPIEVITVDDASTDASGSILEGAACDDERVTIVHHPTNMGLGAARNTGLSRARAPYVWFVDSDDWICSPRLSDILDALEDEDPDILLLGHAVFDGGSVQRPQSDRHLAAATEPPRDDNFRAIAQIFPAAWKRVYKTSFLRSFDMAYPPGAYEDIPVSLPLLLRSRRTSVVDRVCIFYRVRPGSILQEAGQRHRDVARQWRLAIERTGSSDVGRSLVRHALVHHISFLLSSDRLSPAGKRQLVSEVGELLSASGANTSGHKMGRLYTIRFWILRHRAARLNNILNTLLRSAQRAKATMTRAGQALAPTRALRVLRHPVRMLSRVIRSGYYRVERSRRLDDDLAVFGNYWGKAPTGNPLAIAEQLARQCPNIRHVWIVDEIEGDPPSYMRECDRLVRTDSMAYFRSLARAKYLINNVNFLDHYRKRALSVIVQTHHGTPLKAMGVDLEVGDVNGVLRRSRLWDLSIGGSTFAAGVWRRAYPGTVDPVLIGAPRNDSLVNVTEDDAARLMTKAKRVIGVDERRPAVLVAPTIPQDTQGIGRREIGAIAGVRASPSVLFRPHPAHPVPADLPGSVKVVSGHDLHDVFFAADVLVTDVSSIMFDFVLLDRPIVLYAPRLESFLAGRGTYWDLSRNSPGPVCRTIVELRDAVTHALEADEDDWAHRRAEFKRRYADLDDGHAGQAAVEAMRRVGEAR